MTSLEMLMGFWFFTGFLHKKGKAIYSTLFAVFGVTVPEIFNLRGILAFLVFIILLMAVGKLLYRTDFSFAALYAVVTVEIMALCFGLCNSLSYILLPVVFKKNPGICGFVFEWGGNIFALMLAVLCYRVIRQCCTCDETAGRKYIVMILMPALLIFLASEYINENVYGNTVTIEKSGLMTGVDPYQMLFMQALGAVSLFCIMFSYKKLAESFRRDKEAALGISDIDFCIILGNALDNAVSAYSRIGSGKQKYIHMTGKVQGAMEIRTEGEKFVLSILIIIPQQSESISQQVG